MGMHMPAYLIAEHIVTDAAKFHEFRTKIEPMMAKHGGRYLTKGSTHKVLEMATKGLARLWLRAANVMPTG
jgi:uncharacterized protein (DUF1330 family)